MKASRRNFMGNAGLAVPGFLAASTVFATAKPKPNVLFIAFDDMNDWITPLGGHPDAITPNFERLAKQSVLFTKAFCSAPLCCPSRYSTMYGVRPSTSGLYSNASTAAQTFFDKKKSLYEIMSENGYYTSISGKIFHGRPSEALKKHITDVGAHYSQGPFPSEDPLPKGARKKVKKYFTYGALDLPDEKFQDVKNRQWTVDRIKQPKEQPFFITYGCYRPHSPWTVPKRFFDLFDPSKISLPAIKENDLDDVPQEAIDKMVNNLNGTKYQTIKEEGAVIGYVHAYLASLAFADEQLGCLLDTLEESGQMDNTVIVVWSDHGFHFGQKERAAKSALWSDAARCVLMIKAPGVSKDGSSCGEAASLLDIYPTVCELAGVAFPQEQAEGKSLVPFIKNPDLSTGSMVVTTQEYKNHAVRDQEWAYMRYSEGAEELYNHLKDPNEWSNLADLPEYAEVKKRLAKGLPTRDMRLGK